MLNKIAEIANKKLRIPTEGDLLEAGLTRDIVRAEYGSIKNAYMIATNNGLVSTDINQLTLKAPSKSKKRFVITTAPAGQKVDMSFYGALKSYCAVNHASLLVLPQKNGKSIIIDPELKSETFVASVQLNRNIGILGLLSDAKTSDVTTGIGRYGRRNTSSILPGVKQSLKYVATGTSRMPHAIMSTGAITVPSYRNVLSDKRSIMADLDHVIGAIVVEIADNEIFHFRQVQYDSDRKSFYDLGKEYISGKVKPAPPAALVLGDWHSGETDSEVYECFKHLSLALKIKEWVLHDAFNGHSINHHEIDNKVALARRGEHNGLSLFNEIKAFRKDLVMLSEHLSSIIIVKSNHDEFLDRYIKEARYIFDPHNHRYALDLAIAMIDGHDPLKHATDPNGRLTKVKWLQRDESYKIGGVELGAHGDRGSNGAKRASMPMMENAYGKCVVGHSHSAEIMRDVFRVGTSTLPSPSYGDGPSSWTQTGCLVYSNGSRQLLNVINGKVTTFRL